ncbi:hypothetical protein HY214_03885 [Candidatus Roizmanbacteria bacterium]|nr:hypothetical protein [Candidatus Roizmanbacteria bacterium]
MAPQEKVLVPQHQSLNRLTQAFAGLVHRPHQIQVEGPAVAQTIAVPKPEKRGLTRRQFLGIFSLALGGTVVATGTLPALLSEALKPNNGVSLPTGGGVPTSTSFPFGEPTSAPTADATGTPPPTPPSTVTPDATGTPPPTPTNTLRPPNSPTPNKNITPLPKEVPPEIAAAAPQSVTRLKINADGTYSTTDIKSAGKAVYDPATNSYVVKAANGEIVAQYQNGSFYSDGFLPVGWTLIQETKTSNGIPIVLKTQDNINQRSVLSASGPHDVGIKSMAFNPMINPTRSSRTPIDMTSQTIKDSFNDTFGLDLSQLPALISPNRTPSNGADAILNAILETVSLIGSKQTGALVTGDQLFDRLKQGDDIDFSFTSGGKPYSASLLKGVAIIAMKDQPDNAGSPWGKVYVDNGQLTVAVYSSGPSSGSQANGIDYALEGLLDENRITPPYINKKRQPVYGRVILTLKPILPVDSNTNSGQQFYPLVSLPTVDKLTY